MLNGVDFSLRNRNITVVEQFLKYLCENDDRFFRSGLYIIQRKPITNYGYKNKREIYRFFLMFGAETSSKSLRKVSPTESQFLKIFPSPLLF